MKILFRSLFLLAVTFSSHANDIRLSTDIRFTNRAQCALDSKTPTENILVLLSNMDVGRSLYRLAKVKGERDVGAFTRLGLNKYRYTVLSLLELVHQKIVNNQLPLLAADLSQATNLVKYNEISQRCAQASRCPEMDDYLASIWEESSLKTPDFLGIDSFKKNNFLNLKEKKNSERLNCSYLKKFTPLEAHLFGTKPTEDVLAQVAKAAKNVDEYYSDCHDYSVQDSLKVSTYEMSLNLADSKEFKLAGFDYWNTLKIYFSWAFRNSKEAYQMAFPFDEVFSSVLIEDSLFMVPNGCKSLVNPKCDPATINQNSIRLFAKHDFQQKAASLDVFRAIPEGATKNIMDDQFTTVNQDILNFSKFETADSWTESFRQNFSETRLTMRKKFINSVNNLSLMSENLNSASIKSSLENYFAPVLKNNEKVDLQLKSELYYLCAESTFLSSEELSYIRPKLEILGKLNSTDQMTGAINNKSINEIFEYYKKVAENVNLLCSSFDQSAVFAPEFIVDKSGFNRWYVDAVYEGKILSMANIQRKEKLRLNTPLIAYEFYKKSKDIRDVICVDTVDCARTAIQSIVDIYSVVQYSELFLDIKSEISSANMLNPYAERTACKVYDPWFKTKASLFGFATDFAQAAVSAVSPGVVYGNFDLEAGKVTSFNQLVKDGKIVVDPKYEKVKVLSAVALDLGALSNVPCSISVSKSKKIDPSAMLGFKGVTIRTCKESEKNSISVDVSNEIGDNQNKYVKGCLQCSLDFEHVTAVLNNTIPYGRTAFFMARAIIRLYKGLKDPINVPKSWQVNPYLAQASYDSNGGKIPKKCVGKLSSGKSCMKNSCEDSVINKYKKEGLMVESINSNEFLRGIVKVKVKGCSSTNSVKVIYTQDNKGNDSCRVSMKANLNKCENQDG